MIMPNELLILKETDNALLERVKCLIEAAKREVAVNVNSAMTLLYWEIGTYVNSYILDNRRAAYGKQIVVSLSRQLQQEYGTNFILCADKNEEHIELMHLKESNIRVAEYITKLPERTVLEDRLQRAIEKAKHRLANSKDTIET